MPMQPQRLRNNALLAELRKGKYTLNHPYCTIVSAFPVSGNSCLAFPGIVVRYSIYWVRESIASLNVWIALRIIAYCSVLASLTRLFVRSLVSFHLHVSSNSSSLLLSFQPPIYFLSRFSSSRSNLRSLILRDIYAALDSRDASNRNADVVSRTETDPTL